MTGVGTTICCRPGAAKYSFCRFLAGCLLALSAAVSGSAAQEPLIDLTKLFFPLGVVWTTALSGAPSAWPAFDTAQAYVPLRTGKVVAVALEGGVVTWTADLVTTLQPAAGQGSVFVAAEGAIHALDSATGTPRWQVPLGGEFAAPVMWDSGWLVASMADGQVVALRGDTGDRIWARPLGTRVHVPPTIGGDRIYVPLEDGRVVALRLQTGEVLWERQLGGAVANILPLEDRIFAGSKDNFLYRLSVKTGRTEWRWRTGGDIVGAPVVDESNVYFVSLDHLLRALDRDSGAQRWKRELPVRPLAGPMSVEGLVLVAGLGNEMTGFSARDGKPSGRFLSTEEIMAPPHIVPPTESTDRMTYILTGEGVLHALRHMVEPLEVALEFVPGDALGLPAPPPFMPGTPMPLIPPPSAFDEFVPGTPLPVPPSNPFDEFIPGDIIVEPQPVSTAF